MKGCIIDSSASDLALAVINEDKVYEYVGNAGARRHTSEILVALDDAFDITDCVSGKCHDNYCPNKIIFKRLYDGIDGLLSSTTLADMINDYRCVK